MDIPSKQVEVDSTLQANFLQAMRLHTSTVTVVTRAHEGSGLGMTATAICSLTADPPAIVACINRNATICRWLVPGEPLCVNLLAASHRAIACGFAGQLPASERFKSGDWRYDDRGVPYLSDSLSSVFCAVELRAEYYTHAILACRVTDVVTSATLSPLLYGEGAFRNVGTPIS